MKLILSTLMIAASFAVVMTVEPTKQAQEYVVVDSYNGGSSVTYILSSTTDGHERMERFNRANYSIMPEIGDTVRLK